MYQQQMSGGWVSWNKSEDDTCTLFSLSIDTTAQYNACFVEMYLLLYDSIPTPCAYLMNQECGLNLLWW